MKTTNAMSKKRKMEPEPVVIEVPVEKEVPMRIDNAAKIDVYKVAIEKAANGFAERISRDINVERQHCPGIDYGVRKLARMLIQDNIIACEDLFKYLSSHTFNGYDKSTPEWWK